jgi:hypothetical protein
MSNASMNAAPSVPAASRGVESLPAPPLDATIALHQRLRDQFDREAQQHEQRGHRFSWLRLVTFLAAVVLIASAWSQHSALLVVLGVACLVAFFTAVVVHSRTVADQMRALCRSEIHIRHLARLGTGWTRFVSRGETLLPRDHAYAWDIDLVGQGSLFQRIDVTHTRDGAATLAAWLAQATDTQTAVARQAAVQELRELVEWRQELEASAGTKHQHEKLDPSGVEALAAVPSLFATRPGLLWFARIMPPITLAVFVANSFGVGPSALWIVPAVMQAGVLAVMGTAVRHTFDVVAAKAPALEAYKDMLLLLERAPRQSPLLLQLKQRISFGATPPSAHLARLAFWVGLAELRHNFLFHVVVNSLTLWDLHVLHGIERFVRDVGQRANEWFRALGELEALAALATLAHADPDASMPELADEHAALVAVALAHPLLASGVRVPNDVSLRGPETALVVTGSNMAGKSTLLRAVGQNVALALAGGPVIARSMVVPRVRLRASMRADDSLESGESYFHAELSKLKRVIEAAEVSPPVFFLLDELLRGTNARARHVGAKAVLLHLLDRRGTGLCATHDVELAALGQSDPGRIENVHFTDVIIAGEMRFDYKLRPGIVRTSNALRLLAMAGVDVPFHEREALEAVSVRPSDPTALVEPSE